MVKALGNTAWTFASVISGRCGAGMVRGIPPKTEPIVLTGWLKAQTATEPSTTAIRNDGHFGRYRRRAKITTSAATDTPSAAGESVARAAQSTSNFTTTSPGFDFGSRPKRSFSWLVKMITAIPAVKPVTTGSGTYLIQVPRRAKPATINISPASSVASTNPS